MRLSAHPDDESGQLEADGDDVEADDRPTLPRLAAASDEDAVKSCGKKQSLDTNGPLSSKKQSLAQAPPWPWDN